MILRLLAVFAFFSLSNVYADARLIVHLTDYLANDYAGAVSEEGKILSEGEYSEQVEFSQTALREGKANPKLNQNSEILEDLNKLNSAIAKKSPPSLVIPLARKIQSHVIEYSGIELSPSVWPNYTKAAEIYSKNCVSCHGVEGRGDGADGVGLEPAPANFHNMERAPIVSPFAAFNTIRLGVPGTGMAAFSELSDDDIWSLAFYVSSMRFGKPVKSRELISEKFTNEEILEKAAALSDEELRKILKTRDETPGLVEKVRLYFFDSESSDYLSRAESLLNLSLEKTQEGAFAEAEKISLEAYFLGIEPVESKISANDPAAVTRIEEHMSGFRKAIKEQNLEKIKSHHAVLLDQVKALKVLLNGHTMTPGIAFISGFSIILREGFEAVLVILAILGVGKAAASPMVSVAIHSGWVVSIVFGIIGWFLSGWLISLSGASREVMEAVAAFFAVFVLVYVGFWMHRQTEISRWKEFINVKVRNLAQTKNLVGLFILSFFVTFREVIETVLFLRTVYLDTGDGIKIYILTGVLSAFAIVLMVSILISKFRSQISLKKFFNISSALMMFLATTLSGKGMHALQEAGIVGMTVFPIKLRVEILGIFPSWETFVSQVVVLVVSVMIWKMAGKKAN